MQLRELREYAATRNWTIFAEYVDTGWSGAKESRPELNRLVTDARNRRFDAVCVWKLDRWGRSVADSIKSIQELTSLGVCFVAVTQNIDTDESNPMARFLLHIMAAFAELEREIIRERVVAGVKADGADGKTLGRPKRVFRRDQAMRMRAESVSWRKIAVELGAPLTTRRGGVPVGVLSGNPTFQESSAAALYNGAECPRDANCAKTSAT
jgi:putative DNA-invertase from lambdoid prophage Rac